MKKKLLARLFFLCCFVTFFGVASAQPPGYNLSLNGSNQYMSVNNTLGNFGTSDFTMEAWIKTSASGQLQILAKRVACGSEPFTELRVYNGQVLYAVEGVGNLYYIDIFSTKLVNDGVWHHIAATRTATDINLYIDGALDTTKPTVGVADITSTSPFTIGAVSCSNIPFNGNIDEVRIYNTALSPTNIAADMASTTPIAPTNLLAFYNFEALGTNVADNSGNGNTGTLVNITLPTNNINVTANAAANITATGFTASWTDAAPSVVDGYSLQVAIDAGFTTQISGSPFTLQALSQNITGVTPQTNTYFYRVATIRQGILSTYSSAVSTTPIVPVVTTGTATSTANGEILTGTISSPDGLTVTDKGIVYSTTAGPTKETGTTIGNGTAGLGTVTGTVTGLSVGTTIHYRAYATTAEGITYGSDITRTTAALPAAPANVAISGNSATTVSVNWMPVTSATNYVYDVSTSSTFATTLPSYTGITTTARGVTLTGLTSGQQYYFRVATNISGNTGLYNTIGLVTSTVPDFTTNYTFNAYVSAVTSDPTPVPVVDNATFSTVTLTGARSVATAGRYSSNNYAVGLNTTRYYQVTVTPKSGYSVSLSKLTFTVQRAASAAPSTYVIRSSRDNYAANLPGTISPANSSLGVTNGVFTNSDITAPQVGSTVTLGSNFTGLTSAVTFRIYMYGASATTGNVSIDDLSFTGSGSPLGTISGSGSLSALSTIEGTPSSATTFNVSGSGLLAGILVTPPAGFEVSSTSATTGFASTVTVGAAGTVSSIPVWIRLSAAATFPASPYSGNIVLSSAGATSTNVATASSVVTSANALALDKFGFSNTMPAAGAYSLRLLSSGYTGPLVRLAIGTNFYDVYPDATSNKIFSFNSPVSAAYTTFNAAGTGSTTNLLSSVIGSNSATVATWYDQSGIGDHATQGTSVNRPELIDIAGVIDVSNGLPAIKFSGNQFLVTTSVIFQKDLSGSIVYNATAANTSANTAGTWYSMNGIFSSEQPGGVADFGYGVFNGKFTAGNGPSDNSVASGTTVNNGQITLNSWTRSNSTGAINLYTNKTADGNATLNTGTRSAVPSIAIGANQTFAGGQVFYNGSISEMTIFPSVYTSAQRQAVEGDQYAYYAGAPNIGVSGTLAALTTVEGTASTAGTFNVLGSNLSAGILINAPTGFEVSTTSATNGFAGSVTVGTSGNIASTQVWFRLAASATAAGSPYSGDIVLTSTGATTVNLATVNSTVTSANTTVNSIVRNPSTATTNANTVNYDVTFGSAVIGLTASNFNLTTTGAVTGASVGTISGSGTSWTVAVSTGTGSGDITLNLDNATGLTPGISSTLPFAGETYTIDKTAPALTTVTIASNNATTTVAKAGDDITLNFTSSEAINTPTVTVAGESATVTNISGNDWKAVYTLKNTDTEGVLAFNISFSDITSNAGTAVTATTDASSIAFDRTAPTNPVVTTVADGATVTTATPVISGTAEDNSTVTVYINGTAVSTSVVVDGSGNWTYTPSALTSDTYTVKATATDAASNTSGNSNSNTFTVNLDPTITASGTLTALSSTFGTVSANTSFSVAGTNLTNTVTVTAPGGFEVSTTSGSGFAGNLTLTPTTGTLNATIVYVRLAAGTNAGNYTGDVALTSTDATTVNVATVSSTVSAIAISITANNVNKTYGQVLTGSAGSTDFTLSSGSLKNGNTLSSVTVGYGTGAAGNAAVNTYAGSVTPSAATGANGFLATNYDITYAPGNIIVGKGSLNITANTNHKTYGESLLGDSGSTAFTAVGLQNAETIGSVALSYSAGNGTNAPIGTYTGAITPSFATGGTFAAGNYTITYANGDVVITPRDIIVTADAKTKDYGKADPELTYSITSGALAGADAFTGKLTRDAGETVGNYAIKQGTLVLSNNYNLTYAGANLSVNKATITISATGPTKAYGQAIATNTNSTTNFSVDGSLKAGEAITGVTLTPDVNGASATTAAGSGYSIRATAATGANGFVESNYNIVYQPFNGTVTKAALSITANDIAKTYGNLLTGSSGSTAFTAAGLKNNETISSVSINYGTGAATNAGAGNYAASVTPSLATGGTFTPNNYAITYNAGNISVGTKAITVTAAAKSKIYGDADPLFDFTNTALVGTDTFTGNLTRDAGENKGVYAIKQGTLALSSNYTLNYTGAGLTIDARNLTATTDNKTKTYGAANPTFNVIYNGFVNGDDASKLTTPATAVTTATASSSVGTYPITVSGAVTPNYTVVYVPATLTVNKAILNITADSKTRAYGAANPVLTATYSGFVNGDTQVSFNTPASISTNATIASQAGNYAIVASGATSNNYTFTYSNGTLTVTSLKNADLSNLTMNPGNLSPLFNSGTLAYNVSVIVDQVTLTPTLADPTATVRINGTIVNSGTDSAPITLAVGNNTINIEVTAQDGTTRKTYTVTFYRAAPPEATVATNILTPNGDGKNDGWVVKDIQLYPNNKVTIYDRAGREIYSKRGYNNDWNGTVKNAPLAQGTYFYIIELGQGIAPRKGFITILKSR